MLWDEMELISRENMDISKTIRRDGIAGRVIQVATDIAYYNEHHNPGDDLLFNPDFTTDLALKDHSEEYDDTPPADDDGDDTPKT